MFAPPNFPSSSHSSPNLRSTFSPSPLLLTRSSSVPSFQHAQNDDNNASNLFLDDCPAILHQVPDSFDFGLIPVKLCSFCASPSGHYLAIGSQCGALFLFNQRIGQPIKPLRTNYNEVLRLLQFHSPQQNYGQRDQLAIGHQSGTIVLLALPSQQNPLFCQHVKEEAHRGSPLSAICWSWDGRILFSGDHSGLLLAIGVDFSNNEFPVDFLASEPNPILAIAAHTDKLAFSSGLNCKIVKWKAGNDLELIANLEFGQENGIRKLAFNCEGLLRILLENGKIMGMNGEEFADILENLNENEGSKWTKDDDELIKTMKIAVDPSGQTFVLSNGFSNLLICQFSYDQKTTLKLEFVDLAQKLGESNLQVVDICIPNADEFFLLALPRRLIRIGRLNSAPSSLTSIPSVKMKAINVFGSLIEAGKVVGEFQKVGRKKAQGFLQQIGTEEWLGRFNRELDIFLMGDGRKGGWEGEKEKKPNLGEKFVAGFLPIPEPEKLAQGLQQMIGQIRQSSFISTEIDNWSLRGMSTTSRDLGPINWLLPTELSSSGDREEELLSMLDEEKEEERRKMGRGKEEGEEVKVKRRIRKTKRGRERKLSALAEERTLAPTTKKELGTDLEEEEMAKKLGKMDEEREQQMMKMLDGIMKNEELEEEKDKQRNEEDLREKWATKEDEEERSKKDKEGEERNGMFFEEKEVVNNNVLDLTKLLATDVPAEAQSSTSSSSSSSSFNSPFLPFVPSKLFQSICRRMSNYFTGCWSQLDCPFPVGHFAVCRHYLVICPKKKGAHRVRLLSMEAFRRNRREIGCQNWTQVQLKAEAVAINELSTRVWQISSGVASSPALMPDPLNPSKCLSECGEWCETTSINDEGKVQQVAMDTKNAWYLTDRGIFLQMDLPSDGRIGIFFRTQEEGEGERHHFWQLAASDLAVWALNRNGMVLARTGMKLCRMGTDWVEIDGQPSKFISIGLFGRSGFGLDAQGAIWFTHEVTPESPFGVGPWFKCHPIPPSIKSAPISEWRFQIGSNGIFLNVGSSILHSPILFGISLNHIVPDRLVPNDHFALLTAGTFSDSSNANVFECLFACPPNSGELLAFSLHSRTFSLLATLPTPIHSICASQKWLFALDEFGIVHFRPVKSKMSFCWQQFGQPAKFTSIAISSVSIWAISQSNFTIWVAPIRLSDGFDYLNWKEIGVPHQLEKKRAPDQIRVSSSGQSVWIFSSVSGMAWARKDLSARNWRGLSWTKMICDGQISGGISDLAVADSSIWALDKSGKLYWMANPTKLPPIWRPLDFWLNSISVDSLDERIWALDREYRIVRVELDIFPREKANEEKEGKEEEAIMLEKAREMPERTLSGGSANAWCQI